MIACQYQSNDVLLIEKLTKISTLAGFGNITMLKINLCIHIPNFTKP